MAGTCPHGFSPAECLICRTLGTTPQVQLEGSDRTPRQADPQGAFTPLGGLDRGQAPTRPDAIYPPPSRRHWTPSIGGHVALLIGGVLAIAAVAWIVAGVLFAVLHLIELIIIAGLAGWAGYRLGHWRGRHQRP